MDLFFFSLKEFFFYWSKQFDSAKIFLGKHRNGKKCFFFNQETANLGVYASIGLELTLGLDFSGNVKYIIWIFLKKIL